MDKLIQKKSNGNWELIIMINSSTDSYGSEQCGIEASISGTDVFNH